MIWIRMNHEWVSYSPVGKYVIVNEQGYLNIYLNGGYINRARDLWSAQRIAKSDCDDRSQHI